MLVPSFRTQDKRQVQVDQAHIERLRRQLEGKLLTPDAPGYEAARHIWNAMIDRRPALIAQCASTEDVRAAVNFAREHGVLTSVRGGGHNIAGSAVCEGGLMIDLSAMNGVAVNEAERRAVVQPGATLAQLDAATQAHGLVTPLGINSTTGVAGLTLGGGFGWTSRMFGLSADNLISAEVVTASGEILQANASTHPDLYWALRGGGGNFGVVTSFEFKLHPLGPEVLGGLIIHPFEQALAVLAQYRELAAQARDELAVWGVIRKAPPLPFIPVEMHGREILALAAMYAGPLAEAARALQPVRNIGEPIADAIAPMPFTALQQMFDPLLAPGARNYWKSNNFTELNNGLLNVMMEQGAKLPTFGCELFLGQVGGAINRVPQDATAYAQRDAQFVLNVHARWDAPEQDALCIDWARETFARTRPFASGGVYVNFLTQEEAGRVPSAYGPNLQRLALIKRRYDPENLFRHNQNIPPAAQA